MMSLAPLLLALRVEPDNAEFKSALLKEIIALSKNHTLNLDQGIFQEGILLEPQDIYVLWEALEKAAISSLNLSNNQIQGLTIFAIATVLKTSFTLKELDLSHNFIGSKGGRALAEALKVNTTLVTLNLSTNRIGCLGKTYPDSKAIIHLIEVLKINRTLKILDIRNNGFHVSHLIEIINTGLLDNFTLEELKIGQESGLTSVIQAQIQALDTFIQSVDTRLLTPPLLKISDKAAFIVDAYHPEKPFLNLKKTLKDHQDKLIHQTQIQALYIRDIFTIEGIALTIQLYLSDNRMKAPFLTAYQNVLCPPPPQKITAIPLFHPLPSKVLRKSKPTCSFL